MSANRSRSKSFVRRGAALVAALTLLIIVLLTVSALLQQIRSQQQAARMGTNKLQAQWLAESALARAAIRWQQDQTYAGETWAAKPDDSLNDLGTALIEVKNVPDSTAVDVNVTADYPQESAQRARAVLSRRISLPATTN